MQPIYCTTVVVEHNVDIYLYFVYRVSRLPISFFFFRLLGSDLVDCFWFDFVLHVRAILNYLGIFF